MAQEIRVTCSLGITTDYLEYQSRPSAFLADLTTATPKGPTPGAITATTAGTNISFAQLTHPGFCRFANQDAANTVAVGAWDGTNFYPIFDLKPGEFCVLRLSALLGNETQTGTGTADTGDDYLRAKGINGPASLLVEAFEA